MPSIPIPECMLVDEIDEFKKRRDLLEAREHDILQGPPPLPADLLKRCRPPTYIERIGYAIAMILMIPLVLGAAWVVISVVMSLA